jgi:hypothetical protein
VRRPLLAALVLLALCPVLLAQGKLERVRQEVQADEQPAPSGKPPKKDDTDGDCFLGSLLGGLLSVFACGASEANEGGESRCGFLPYPYAHDYPGYVWRTPAVACEPPAELKVGGGSGRVFLDNGNDFDGLNRLGGQLFLDTARGWGLRLDGNWFDERLPCGCHDDSFLGSALVTWRLIERQRFQLYLGAGCVFWSDPSVTKAGFDCTASFDLYPVKPVVVSGLFDLGALGSALYSRARLTAGYLWGRWELFGGYDFQRVGDVNLRGPLLGVRLWF